MNLYHKKKSMFDAILLSDCPLVNMTPQSKCCNYQHATLRYHRRKSPLRVVLQEGSLK